MTIDTLELTAIQFYESSNMVCIAVGMFSNSKINVEIFYNWSSYYALAVIELGQAVKANRALTSTQSNAR